MTRSGQPLEPAEYLTAEQLAELLQVSPKSIFRWATEDPSMPCLRLGRAVRFPKARILAWLRGREQGPGRPVQHTDQHMPAATPRRTLARRGVSGAGARVPVTEASPGRPA